jgi:multicomponent Na+:H+ antiporter subunit C
VSAALVLLVGVLFGAGTYLVMNRSLTRIVLGVALLGNGVNVLIVAASSGPGEAPIVGRDGTLTDSVPQALVLTAIVIGFAIVSFLVALAWRNWTIGGNDSVEDDVEDRRVAREQAALDDARSDEAHHEDVER